VPIRVERRFVLFIALTLLLWTGYILARIYLFPPPPEPVAQAPDDPAEEKQPGGEIGEKPVEPAEVPKVKPAPVEAEPATSAAPERRVALGSLGGKSPMLATFISRGAAVERVELSGYNAIDDDTGYLGHLGLTDDKDGGAVINIVGGGTPAALATTTTAGIKPGLLAGDIIHDISGQPVDEKSAVEKYLAEKSRPGDTLNLTVTRQGVAQPIKFTAKLTRRPLEIVRPETHVYETDDGDVKKLPQDPLSLLVSVENIGGRNLKAGEAELPGLPSLAAENWTIDDQGADFVQFSYTLSEEHLAALGKTGSWKIVKRYTLARPEKPGDQAFHVDLKIELHNLGEAAQQIAYRLDGPTGLPTEGWWYSSKLHPKMFYGAGSRDVAFFQDGRGHRLFGNPEIVSESKAAIAEDKLPRMSLIEGDEASAMVYAGVDTQFYASMILPQPMASGEAIKFRRAEALPVQDVMEVPKSRLRTLNVSVRLATPPINVEPNEPLVHEYRVFLGPKQADPFRLRGPEANVLGWYDLEPLIEYGWSIFGVPAKALQYVLLFLYSLTGNYGIAIVLLTVIVRSCMVPISLKQARAAAKMQELAPEIQKIKDKHPDDPMKQHAAVQELYKKHKFNPFGGCLLVFIQLPIFIGLYRCLSVDIDLRDASLIPGLSWASNLAGPDKVFYWKDYLWAMFADEGGWLGPYFNILPIITVVLFLIQQKMFTPPATDEQTQMQQKMMTYMTVFMGVMFYKVPAGLCLYFIVSSTWGICERKFLSWMKARSAAGAADGGARGGSSGGDGGAGATALLPPKPASPNGSSKPASKKKQKQRR
jgi:YidC/Oxa1 family membrane protein insertase